MKVKKTLIIDKSIWDAFEEKVRRKQLNFSEEVEKAIAYYVEKDKVEKRFGEISEYLHWILAIACKLWLEDKKEAKVLFEAVRRISKLLNLFNVEVLSTAFINPKNEFVISNYPWTLIYVDNGYLVRLIVNRCEFCGKDDCPCIDPEDCDKVEVEMIANSLDDALKILAKLYLSYFFSKRAYDDGIGSRIEIVDEYLSIKRELEDGGILIDIGERDEKKMEKIRKRRIEKHKEAHLKLVEIVTKDYGRIREKVDMWMEKFRKEIEGASKQDLESILNNCIHSLNNLHLVLSEICKRSKGSSVNRICITVVRLIGEVLDKINSKKRDFDKEEVEVLLEDLNRALELIVENADKLVRFDIKPNSLIYNNRLAYGIRSIVATVACLESMKKLITS